MRRKTKALTGSGSGAGSTSTSLLPSLLFFFIIILSGLPHRRKTLNTHSRRQPTTDPPAAMNHVLQALSTGQLTLHTGLPNRHSGHLQPSHPPDLGPHTLLRLYGDTLS